MRQPEYAFFAGSPIQNEVRTIGLKTDEIEQRVLNNGIAAIVGGYKSGKSTETIFAIRRLMEKGFVDLGRVPYVGNADYDKSNIERVESKIAGLDKDRRGVVVMDEIQWDSPVDNVLSVLDWMAGVRNRGHVAIVELNGDYRFPTAYIPEAVGARLRESVGNSMVIRSLRTDDDMRLFFSASKPVFNDDDIEWLVKQAGG